MASLLVQPHFLRVREKTGEDWMIQGEMTELHKNERKKIANQIEGERERHIFHLN